MLPCQAEALRASGINRPRRQYKITPQEEKPSSITCVQYIITRYPSSALVGPNLCARDSLAIVVRRVIVEFFMSRDCEVESIRGGQCDLGLSGSACPRDTGGRGLGSPKAGLGTLRDQHEGRGRCASSHSTNYIRGCSGCWRNDLNRRLTGRCLTSLGTGRLLPWQGIFYPLNPKGKAA